jgi:hypothetical protein
MLAASRPVHPELAKCCIFTGPRPFSSETERRRPPSNSRSDESTTPTSKPPARRTILAPLTLLDTLTWNKTYTKGNYFLLLCFLADLNDFADFPPRFTDFVTTPCGRPVGAPPA